MLSVVCYLQAVCPLAGRNRQAQIHEGFKGHRALLAIVADDNAAIHALRKCGRRVEGMWEGKEEGKRWKI